MFWYILLGLLAGFGIMFFLVKSGRLTVYMVVLDGLLIKAEPILESVSNFDFSEILSAAQQSWIILITTVLAGVARVRGQILDAVRRE